MQENGLPVWIGIFDYREPDGGIEFSEKFAISSYKIGLFISELNRRNPDLAERVGNTDGKNIDVTRFCRLEGGLKSAGIDLWSEINRPELNNLDIDRRNEIMNAECLQAPKEFANEVSDTARQESLLKDSCPSPVERFFEFEMKTWYPISAEEYLFSSTTNCLGEEVFSVPTEVAYMRFRDPRFHPHFLGAREKYKKSAGIIEKYGRLDENVLKRFMDVYENAKVSNMLVSTFTFTRDMTLDYSMLRRQLKNGMRPYEGEPNYLTMLMDGTHYKRIL